MRTINWNAAKLKALKAARDTAMQSPTHRTSDSFRVQLPGEKEAAEFHIGYAGYLIKHLDETFAANPPHDYGENLEGEEGQ